MKPTDAEATRLIHLIEECAEVQKAATKILRFGYESTTPYNPALGPTPTNRRDLETELGHILAHKILLIEAGDLDLVRIVNSRREKLHYLTGNGIFKTDLAKLNTNEG